MIEKVNPSHPDKVADRIAGAIVDLAYKKTENPKVAVEVLIGHNHCHIIAETSVQIGAKEASEAVGRIMDTEGCMIDYVEVPQDAHLAENQSKEIRCGDNGIFKGVPISKEEEKLSGFIRALYTELPTDGKFIYDEQTQTFIACQSNTNGYDLEQMIKFNVKGVQRVIVNPLGEWTGGTNVDTGATNRKLGSDMGRAVTGGGLHGKDLSKADVAVNVFCHDVAQREKQQVEALCAIGDSEVELRFEDGRRAIFGYEHIVRMAGNYIRKIGGFEKLAEWGLLCPGQ